MLYFPRMLVFLKWHHLMFALMNIVPHIPCTRMKMVIMTMTSSKVLQTTNDLIRAANKRINEKATNICLLIEVLQNHKN